MLNMESNDLASLSNRLKQVSETLNKQADTFYRARGIDIQARYIPIIQLLAQKEAISVTDLAKLMGQTHPSISQMSKKLEASGWIYHRADHNDDRRRMLALTPKGYELVDEMQPLWRYLEKAITRLLSVAGGGLIENLKLLERELDKRTLLERVEIIEKEARQGQIEIIHFEPQYAKDFYRLNKQWIDRYFYLESLDHELLSDPQSAIVDKGGFVLLARLDNKIVGAAALTLGSEARLELSKICVDEDYQGIGVGEKLAKAAIHQFHATEFSHLCVESNRKLVPALNLCFKLGFVEKPFPKSHKKHQRADVYLELERD